MKLDIVTPERRLRSLASQDVNLPVDVLSVVIPGREGQFEVLPGHAPFVTVLGTGVVTFDVAGRKVELMVSGGFCEVDRDSVNLMCESASLAEDVKRDEEQTRYAGFERDLSALGAASLDDAEFIRLKKEVDRARTKLTLVK